MLQKYVIPLFLILLLLGVAMWKKNDMKGVATLNREIAMTIGDVRATVGVSVIDEQGNRVVAYDDERLYPLLSVLKFPCALAVLDKLQREQLPLSTAIRIISTDLHPDTYSPMCGHYADGYIDMTVAELLHHSLSLGDNNACDILMRYVGGVDSVESYIHSIGFPRMTINVTDTRMHDDYDGHRLNRATPHDVAGLFHRCMVDSMLQPYYHHFLVKSLTTAATAGNKLRGKLPRHVVVGHKNGASTRRFDGMKYADNDAGFVVLPDGRRYFIAVFVADSYESDAVNATVISSISSLVYQYISRGAVELLPR